MGKDREGEEELYQAQLGNSGSRFEILNVEGEGKLLRNAGEN